ISPWRWHFPQRLLGTITPVNQESPSSPLQKGIPMPMSTQTRNKPASELKQKSSPSSSPVRSSPISSTGAAMPYKAWMAKAAKQPMVFEAVDPGPLGAEDVQVAVEHCGLCHSDLSVLNNE